MQGVEYLTCAVVCVVGYLENRHGLLQVIVLPRAVCEVVYQLVRLAFCVAHNFKVEAHNVEDVWTTRIVVVYDYIVGASI